MLSIKRCIVTWKDKEDEKDREEREGGGGARSCSLL